MAYDHGGLSAGRSLLPADEAPILCAAEQLAAAGVSVHWLQRRTKKPVGVDGKGGGWQTAETQTIEELQASYRRGYNIGLRPGEHSHTPYGYLHVIDLDIRKEDQVEAALAELRRLWPDYSLAPFVISGSGGSSRHFYFFTDKPFGSMKLGRSEGSEMVFDASLGRDVKKADWEIELYGSRKQIAIPPSIHPVSGENYVWGREIDWDLLQLDIGPIIPSATVTAWGAASDDDLTDDDDDDLFAILKSEPMGLTEQRIDEILGDIPNDDLDYDDFVEVGMALAHEYQGNEAGFNKWVSWCRQSRKFDLHTCKFKWRSFKGRKNPVRMATLIAKAGVRRLEEAHAELDLLDDDDALEPSTALTVIEPEIDLLADLDLLADMKASSNEVASRGPTGPEQYDSDWASYLQRNEEGTIKPTLHNVEMIVRNDRRFRGVIGLNQFTQEITQIGRPRRFKLRKESPKPIRQLEGTIWELSDPVNGDLWKEVQDADVRLILEAPERQGGYGLKTSGRDLTDAINKVAYRNGFHPVRGYLNGLVWDGEARAATLFVDYLGAEDNPYHREAALKWLLGAVTRIFEPGHKFDFVPILEGAQGKRKSTFISVLARHWSAELEGDFHDTKGMVERMQGAWILEMPELQGFSKSDVQTIKGFISRTMDKVRPAYARRVQEYPRQCVFMGSTNEIEYLRDSTGGRRFWPITCTVVEIDTDRLIRNIDQIWAEAVAMYREWRVRWPTGHLPLYMTNPVAAAYAKELQESRREEVPEDILAGEIERWFNAPIGSELGLADIDGVEPEYRDEICSKDIWVEVMGNDAQAPLRRSDALTISRALRNVQSLHVVSGSRDTSRWGRQRVYRRVLPPMI